MYNCSYLLYYLHSFLTIMDGTVVKHDNTVEFCHQMASTEGVKFSQQNHSKLSPSTLPDTILRSSSPCTQLQRHVLYEQEAFEIQLAFLSGCNHTFLDCPAYQNQSHQETLAFQACTWQHHKQTRPVNPHPFVLLPFLVSAL